MDSRLNNILQYAIMAPSGDNCQPWQFAINNNKGTAQIELYNDPQCDTSLYNLKQRASMIAHGAALENIRIAAPTVGMRSSCKLFPDPSNLQHIATITFTEAEMATPPLLSAIALRHTNREKYQPVNFSDNQLQCLTSLPELEGQKVWLGTQRQQVNHLATLLSLNDRLVFATPALHRFLFEQIRWNNTEAVKTGDGLDIATLGLNAMDKIAFKFLRHWGVVAALHKLGFLTIIQQKSKQLIKSASAIAMVIIPKADAVDYVQGGQLWQRLLLQLASDGLSVQPIAGLACLMQAAVEGLLTGQMTDKQHQQLVAVRKELLLSAGAGDGATILAIFRIGAGKQVPRALRRPLEKFLV